MKKVSAIVYHEHGIPQEVARLEESALVEPLPNEVLVKIAFAPINPADLNLLEGKYPVRPKLPAVGGVEGAGVIEQIGGDVKDFKIGDHVLIPWGVGTWREACVVLAERLTHVPADIALEEAAMLRVNPPTAWRMLHDFVTLERGDWVIQNAANSGVGRAVIQIARDLGLRTVNIVRRPELIPDLEAEGGDVVLVEGEDLRARIKDGTGGASIALALNCVGGESALNLANALAPGGTIVTYGAMSRQPLRIPNGLLIFQDLRWRGFWITQWYQTAPPAVVAEMFARLFLLAQRGVLKTTVDRRFSLGEVNAALAAAQAGGRSGKILFKMQ